MYGLVNKAIEGLITTEFGEEKWNEIKNKAGFTDDTFISMTSYDDSITYNLVGAASEVTQLAASDLLEAFGEYWVTFTAEEGYGDMLKMAGDTFKEFLSNLNNLHQRVGNMMPDLVPPFFEVEEIDDNEIDLSYISKREGLVPMVVGLLRGLAKRFNIENLQITTHDTHKEDDDSITKFNLKWS